MSFLAGVWYDNRLQFNSYHAGFTLLTMVDQPKEFNLAMERLKYLVYDMFTDTVFIDSADQEQIVKLVQAGLKVTTLPDVPVDQIVNIALFCKGNAVMERKMTMLECSLSSEIGDNVMYSQQVEESLGPFAQDGWWHTADTKHAVLPDTLESSKIIDINANPSWRELGLNFSRSRKEADRKEDKVLYADFRKNDK